MDPKKKSLRARERDEAKRAAWREDVAPLRPQDLVFLDETGSHLGYTPTHARAPRGERAYATAPANRGENKTVVASLTLDGVGPLMRFDGAMTTARCSTLSSKVGMPIGRVSEPVPFGMCTRRTGGAR